MPRKKFHIVTPEGENPERHTYVVLGNAATYEAPEWHPMGKKVTDSSAENDFSSEDIRDILGGVYGEPKNPIIKQSFDGCRIDSGDKYQAKLVDLHIVDNNYRALANQDLLRLHTYLEDDEGNCFAERYPSSQVLPKSLGGEGGGPLTMPTEVTFGGIREPGTCKVTVDESGKKSYAFTPGIEEAE